jgi:ATP-dependent helicase/nuclease subunit B
MHAPFIPTLAAAILEGTIWAEGAPAQHELPQLTVYLPTQAAAEPLKLAFLALSPNGATFLPRIRVLGEADPADLFATYGTRMDPALALELLEEALAVPPAFGELERRVQLAALAMNASQSLLGTEIAHEPLYVQPFTPASAFAIAGQIASLIGEAHEEGADLARVGQLESSRTSGSEQLSLQLLRSVLRGWQAHKAKAGKLDREEHRNRLMAIEAEFIRQSDAPVVIAGSTGSLAATSRLMQAALSRPRSALVLYGLGDSAAGVEAHPEHPQHGLKLLLNRFGLGGEDVFPLSTSASIRGRGPSAWQARESELARGGFGFRGREAERRAGFLSEALRPAPATAEWAPYIERLRHEESPPAPGVSLIETQTVQDEAAAIALILRESLETTGQTAALVTPSETLIARVRHALAQWGLANTAAAADAGGTDSFAARTLSCAASAKPDELVELLRQARGSGAAEILRTAEIVDIGVLRQMWRPVSLAGVPAALSRAQHATASGEARHPAIKRITAAEWDAARSLAGQVIEALSPLTAVGEHASLPDWLAAHRKALALLAGLGLSSAESASLQALEQAATRLFKLDLAEYAEFFAQVMSSRRACKLEQPHPRIFIWKPLDARLLSADVMVLGGLNEGCWPQMSGPDPWLSRNDRKFIGLQPPERRIGRSAHDFVALAASAPRVILTRARKENGSLTRPSRWISRILALVSGAGKLDTLRPEKPWLSWSATHRAPEAVQPASRPEPRPPLAARPRRLSVTAIETWLANPYAIYARQILGLDPLRQAGETSDARDKGILYHAALHGFFQAYPRELPENGAAKLLRQLDKAAEELGFNLENAPFWRPRFARFAEWFAGSEAARREGVTTLKSEVGGKLEVEAPAGPFEITARADRIDRFADGRLIIYDFKTSTNAAKTSARREAPQLALEGLLAKEGAFAGIAAGASAELLYVVATGGEPPGEIVPLKVACAEAIEAARTGTRNRIALFDDPATPYAYEARAIFREKAENDPFAHLARVREWQAGADDSEGGDE